MTVQPRHPVSTASRLGGVAAVASVVACLTAGALASATAAVGSESPATRLFTPCTVDRSELPRTADAAAYWLSTCYDVEQLPRTADAVDHWLG